MNQINPPSTQLDLLDLDLDLISKSQVNCRSRFLYVFVAFLLQIDHLTSMHSSRMRTARLLTVSHSIRGGVCPGGMFA